MKLMLASACTCSVYSVHMQASEYLGRHLGCTLIQCTLIHCRCIMLI